NYLQQFGLINLFPDHVQEEMYVANYARGDRFISQDSEAHAIYFLVEGKMKISMLSPEGKRLILAFRTPFVIVGDDEDVWECLVINTVEAVRDSVGLPLPYEAPRKHTADNAAWPQFLLEPTTHTVEPKARAMDSTQLGTVDVRGAGYRLS